MVLDSLLDKVPLFILSSFFLSYLLWARFRSKNGKLGIKTVDNLLDILGIFFIIVVSASLFFIAFEIPAFMFVVPHFRLGGIYAGLKFFISFIGLILIFYTIILFRKTASKNLFKWILFLLFSVQLVSVTLFLAWALAIFLTNYRSVFYFRFLLVLILLLFGLLPSKSVIDKAFFNYNQFTNRKINTKKNSFKLKTVVITTLLILLVVIFVVKFISIPKFSDARIQVERTIVNVDNVNYPKYSSDISVYTEIKTFGKITSGIREIPINYGRHGLLADWFVLINRSDGSKNLIPLGDKANQEYQFEGDGFTTATIDMDQKVLFLRFDPASSHLKNVTGIILKGTVTADISDTNYKYSDSRHYEKNRKDWFVNIQITNNIDNTVVQESNTIMNFLSGEAPDNYKICRLSDIDYKVDKELQEIEADCNNKECFLELRRGRDHVFYAYIAQEDGIVRLDHVKIEEPLDINMTVKIRC